MASDDVCKFTGNLSTGSNVPAAHSHSHDHESASHSHSHDPAVEHGHTHEHLEHAGIILLVLSSNLPVLIRPFLGKFGERELPDYSGRDFKERGFTVGIGG
jgi:urease accessory protein